MRELTHFSHYDTEGFHLLIKQVDSHPFIQTFGLELVPKRHVEEQIEQDIRKKLDSATESEKIKYYQEKLDTVINLMKDRDMKAIKVYQMFQMEFDMVVGLANRSYRLSN